MHVAAFRSLVLLVLWACSGDPAETGGAAGGTSGIVSSEPAGAASMAQRPNAPDAAPAPAVRSRNASSQPDTEARPEAASDSGVDGGEPAQADAEAQPAIVDGGEPSATPPTAFYAGTWHVGWSGGLDHYSWMRLHPDASGMAGTWETAPVLCPFCDEYFPCTGADGTFTVDADATTISFTLPSPCDIDGYVHTWSELRLLEPTGGHGEAGSDLRVVFLANGSYTSGHRYPDEQCPDLSTCDDPRYAQTP